MEGGEMEEKEGTVGGERVGGRGGERGEWLER